MPRLLRGIVCYALWFMWALPIAPGLYSAGLEWPVCFGGKLPPEMFSNPAGCLWASFVMGPTIVIVGPLAPGEAVTASRWPAVLMVAAIVAAIATLAASMARRWCRQI